MSNWKSQFGYEITLPSESWINQTLERPIHPGELQEVFRNAYYDEGSIAASSLRISREPKSDLINPLEMALRDQATACEEESTTDFPHKVSRVKRISSEDGARVFYYFSESEETNDLGYVSVHTHIYWQIKDRVWTLHASSVRNTWDLLEQRMLEVAQSFRLTS